MTTLEVVNNLRAKGHVIDYYVRKDGGILIKSIDGKKYTGALGNNAARKIVGQPISEARKSQLKAATKTRKAYQTGKRQRITKASDTLKKEYQRVKKVWNKSFKAKNGKPSKSGYLPWTKIDYTLQTEGEAAALERLAEAERYATGLAYTKNIDALASFIRDASSKLNGNDKKILEDLANDIEDNRAFIREEYIYEAYQALYKINTGAKIKAIDKQVRRILRLDV